MRGNFIYKRLGQKICKCRKKMGLSQEDLGFLAKVDRTFIGQMEVGKANPSFKTLTKLSRAFKIPISELLKGI